MTNYDIKFRRNSLTSGQIERHKDFRKLNGLDRAKESKNASWWRMVIVLFVLVTTIMMIVFGVSHLMRDRNAENTNDHDVYKEFKEQ